MIFSKPEQLLKLAEILEYACSDDETDGEASCEGSKKHGQPCVVRILDWRSERLRYACILLDAYIERRKSSIPRAVRKYTGRPPRPRIRQQNAAFSKLPAPPGLPIDCYSSTWLEKLEAEDPLHYSELEIDPVPALDKLVSVLEGL